MKIEDALALVERWVSNEPGVYAQLDELDPEVVPAAFRVVIALDAHHKFFVDRAPNGESHISVTREEADELNALTDALRDARAELEEALQS